jgi:hypothetical protein
MAGEFHVMELLFRLEHEPAFTLGNAKSIDILPRSPKGNLYEVSDYSRENHLVFVFLHYKPFSELSELPDIWIVPAVQSERIKRRW